jgi:RNA polymerase sigma-70 factor (ECF subfamily)
LVRALNSLDEESRALLVLRDLQDLDYQQLAEVFELPLGTVKSRLFRARESLRTALEGMGL